MKDASIIRISFIGILMALLLVACQSKPRGYMNSFERFVERVEKNASSYSKEQWDRNDEQLQRYVERYNSEKSKLTTDEKRKVGELTGRYYEARMKSMSLNLFSEIRDWLDFIKGFADEIKEDIENYQNQ